MNSVPTTGNLGKDITVNWKMYDGFDPQNNFFTDSNSLAMQERILNKRQYYNFTDETAKVSGNYYPIDSAIAMRDQNGSNTQVTIMTERAEGGSADIDKATIELMQNRRLTEDDNKGVIEPLNEMNSDGTGIKVITNYYM